MHKRTLGASKSFESETSGHFAKGEPHQVVASFARTGKFRQLPSLHQSSSEEIGLVLEDVSPKDNWSEKLQTIALVSGQLFFESVSTLWIEDLQNHITSALEDLFISYSEEEFEEGMENDFVYELKSYVLKYGTRTMHSIARVLDKNIISPQLAFEAVRSLGYIIHPESYRWRLFLLEKCLNNESRWIRDAAALGLSALKDPHSIPYLSEAIRKEPIEELRLDMEMVLIRLRHSDASFPTEDNKTQVG